MLKPQLKQRPVDEQLYQKLLSIGLDEILARIVAARPFPAHLEPQQLLQPALKHLDSPANMQDMTKAAERLAHAVIAGEVIGIETDHDCDGQTSHAVIFEVLTKNFNVDSSKIRSYIGHRLTEGYGLSQSVATRILQDKPCPSLVITADNGSSDEPRIAELKQAGIDVIVTDHHALPMEGPPRSAYACLNPTRKDCNFEDSLIAGCMVAWLLMAATRKTLIKMQHLPDTAPGLSSCLDFVAVGTIADCVSIARSKNNRAVINAGIKIIKSGKRPCWRALLPTLPADFTAEDLAFTVGPLLNSDGRLSSAFGSVSFLLAETDSEAQKWVANLREQNKERKEIQAQLIATGTKQAAHQVENNKFSLTIFIKDGHAGVHGIAASRISEKFGRPSVFFAPKLTDENLLTGSVRGVKNFHVRDALQQVAEQLPQQVIAFGGHEGAGGITLHKDALQNFSDNFEQAVKSQLQQQQLGPVIWTDGALEVENFNIEFVKKLAQLEPFGREFEAPIFTITADVVDYKMVGANPVHAQLVLDVAGNLVKAIWFNMLEHPEDAPPIAREQTITAAMVLKIDEFRNQKQFKPQIVWAEAFN